MINAAIFERLIIAFCRFALTFDIAVSAERLAQHTVIVSRFDLANYI